MTISHWLRLKGIIGWFINVRSIVMFPLLEPRNDGLDAVRGVWNGIVAGIVAWCVIFSIGYVISMVW